MGNTSSQKVTLSLIKADVGSIGGHTKPSKLMMATVRSFVKAHGEHILLDSYISHTGDDIAIFMTHRLGEGSSQVHKLAWDAFVEATKIAKQEGLYGAGQDLLKDAFSGNVKGLGPAVAEMEITPRPSEAILVFAADKCGPGAYNLPFYLAFCDPIHNAGPLLNTAEMGRGFTFQIMDVNYTEGDRVITLQYPEDVYDIVALLRDNDRFVIESVWSRNSPEEQILAISTSRLHNISGKYSGKDDPVAIVRTQKKFPAPEEILSPFKIGPYVLGDARGSHVQPLVPEKINTPITTPFCIPIVSCLAFSMLPSGQLSEPVDMFATRYWDYVRQRLYEKADEMRVQGFSGPAMGHITELEYGGIAERMENLESRFTVRKSSKKSKFNDENQ